MLGLHCRVSFSPVVGSGGCSLAVALGLLTAVASLVTEPRPQGVWARQFWFPGLWGTSSMVVAYRLGCPTARGIFLDQGLNPCLLHWQADSLPLSHQGSLTTDLLGVDLWWRNRWLAYPLSRLHKTVRPYLSCNLWWWECSMNTIIPVTSEQLWGESSEQHLLCPVAKKSVRSCPGSCQDTGLMGKPSLWPWACGNMKKLHRHSNCFTTITATHISICQQNQCLQQKNKRIYIFRNACFIWKMSVPVAP